MPQHVRVVPPDPAWAEGYRRERALLMPVFGPLLVELHHIGSTAVEGLWAKPILDLMPVVTSLEAVDRLDPELEAGGISARAGTIGPTSSTSFRRATGRISSGIWRCGTICGPARRSGRPMGR